jgi:malate dehydrogenase
VSVIGVPQVEAARGGRLVVRAGDVVTPLARDRAAELRVTLEFEPGAGGVPEKTAPASRARPLEPDPPPGSNGQAASDASASADPPSGTLYRRGAPVVDDRVRVETVLGEAAPGATALGAAPARTPGSERGRAAVVGAGHVGATTALRLAEADVFDEVVMVDVLPGLAAGLALDLWHSAGLGGFATRLRGAADLSEAAGADFVVITAGRPRTPGMSRTDLTAANAAIVGAVAEAVRNHCPDAIVVVVTNPLDEMTELTWRTTGFPPERVMGMAGVLDATRFCALAALALDVRPDAVSALALGSHGDEMVVPLSQARVGGEPITARLDPATLQALVDRTRNSGAEVVKLLEKGSAYYAPAAAVARMVLAMAGDTGEILPACVRADGAYGIHNVYLGLPARLGRGGVLEVVEVPLSPAERDELHTAAGRIAERVGSLVAPAV